MPVSNSAIQNNTCYKNDYSNTGYGELYLSYSEHCLIENNIFFLSAANQWMYAELGQPSLNFNYNNVYSDNSPANLQADWNGTSYSSFATFVTASATNNHSIVGNPLLNAANITAPDFHIKIGSAAINAGDPLFIAATEERDMDNQFRVSGIVDCGADEYYPSTVTYTFTGNGNWTEPSYWNNHSIPPDTLMAGDSIIINPVAGGQCILDKTQHISTGATIIINPGKNLLIPGMLKLN